jgi:hypothetical protein
MKKVWLLAAGILLASVTLPAGPRGFGFGPGRHRWRRGRPYHRRWRRGPYPWHGVIGGLHGALATAAYAKAVRGDSEFRDYVRDRLNDIVKAIEKQGDYMADLEKRVNKLEEK